MDDRIGVDMEQSTGGHHLDTGDGPVALDATEPPTRTQVWAAYQSHRDVCSQCQTSVWRCAEGNDLWNAVIA